MTPTPRSSRRLSQARTLGAVCAWLALAGCTTLDVPRADNYPISSQKKARAVHHWDVLADDVAARVAAKLAAAGRSNAAVQVSLATETAFKQGFRELLMTRLLEHGVFVATGTGALRLEVGTQVVQHEAGTPLNQPAPWTTLGASVAVARDLHKYAQSSSSFVFNSVVAGAVLDVANYQRRGSASGGPTDTEVLVSTALHDGSLFLARTADVYYIEGADLALYQPPPPPPPAPVATPLKTWKVVAE